MTILDRPGLKVDAITFHGGVSSVHRHTEMNNTFYVERGELSIRTWHEGDEQTMYVRPGRIYMVSAGVWHQLEVVRPGTGVEVYWSHLARYDIERAT